MTFLIAALVAFALLAVWLALEPGRSLTFPHFQALRVDPSTEARANACGQGREGLWEGFRQISANGRRRAFKFSRALHAPDRLSKALMPLMAGGAPTAQAGNSGGAGASPPAAAAPVVPFDQASHRGYEQGPVFEAQIGAATKQFGPEGLPAQGFLRSVILQISSSGGVVGPGTVGLDFPFNVLNLVRLQDTNGAPMCELSGFNLMLMNTYGGFAGSPDPRNDPDFSAAVVTPSFAIRIPVEFSPNGMGSLANQSQSASYKLTVILESNAVFLVQPTTTPTVKISTFMEFWTLPAAMDMLNRQQVRTPPFHGTAQYFTQQMNLAIPKGASQQKVTRTGSLIRTLAFVCREAGVRSEKPFPDPFTFNWDSRDLQIASKRLLRKLMREFTEQLSARDVGVYVFGFSYGEHRHFGENEINSWLPTVSATRLEIVGTTEEAGTQDVVVNDVSVAETNPQTRAVEQSATGYHPPVAPTVIGAQ
jgi:hypothetical protein